MASLHKKIALSVVAAQELEKLRQHEKELKRELKRVRKDLKKGAK